MPFPKNKLELEAAGYKFQCRRPCKGATCKTTLQIWETPKNKLMPLEVDDVTGAVMPHHATCPDVAAFRKADKPIGTEEFKP